MHYCDHALSVVRPSSSVRQSSVVNFSHFWLLLRNRWTQFNETWQEARSLRSLPSLCFSGRSEKQNGRPGLWLAETFSTSLKLLNRIQRNLTGSQISTTSSKCVVFWPIRKTRWPPWPLICWDIFDFSSETAERNSMKLYRKQELTVLYQFCVFQADRKNKMAALVSDWLRHFRLLLWNRWTEYNETWQEARSQCPLPSLCFFGPIRKQKWPPWLTPKKGGTLYSGARYVALWAYCSFVSFLFSLFCFRFFTFRFIIVSFRYFSHCFLFVFFLFVFFVFFPFLSL